MTQHEKNLLIKDLCARLDTNLVCSIYRTDDEGVGYRDEILHGYCKGDIWYEFYFREDCSIGIDNVSKIKPYLFPLSNMTEEQYYEMQSISGKDCLEHMEVEKKWRNNSPFNHLPLYQHKVIEFFHKHHFDYRGLIPMGLANDATGLNIY